MTSFSSVKLPSYVVHFLERSELVQSYLGEGSSTSPEIL